MAGGVARTVAIVALCAAPVALWALGVKVERLDRQAGRIRLLVPTHSMRLEAEALPGAELDARLRTGEFYEATIRREGKLPNVLRVKVPGGKDARYRVVVLTVLD